MAWDRDPCIMLVSLLEESVEERNIGTIGVSDYMF